MLKIIANWIDIKKLWNNPILLNELRIRMRGRRTFMVLAAHLFMLSGLVLLIYGIIYQDTESYNYYDAGYQRTLEASANLGKAVFYSSIMLLLFIICLIGPAFSAGTLVGEKERQTYDLLIITGLPARQIVLGKLRAVLIFMGLLILAALPFQTMAYFFGGITLSEILIAVLILYLTTLLFCSLGICVSSFARSTTQANMLNYAVIIPLLLGVPLLVFVMSVFSLTDPFLFDDPSPFMTGLLVYLGLVLLSLNPLSMAVTSEIFFLETDSYIFSMEQVAGQYTFPLLAPWLIYVVFAFSLSFIFIRLAVHRIDQVRPQ